MRQMELLTSALIRAPHGFPTREGGVSEGPFASLNAALSVGDERARVEENLRRLAGAAGVDVSRLLTVSQVHGEVVLEARAAGAPGAVAPPLGEADALWTQEPGVAVGVRTADCLPILFEDPVGHRVAAAHAGWRGVLAEIAARTVAALAAAGSRPGDLRVAVGPCIQRCCFEVDGDLPERFERAFGAGVVARVAGKEKRHLDLPLAVKRTLLRAGVPEAQLERVSACTACDRRFFSHRRDRGVTGRHLSFITRP